MKVKLSYTVEESELLGEVALVLQNQAPKVQEFIDIFNKLSDSLLNHETEDFNLMTFRDRLSDGRLLLAKVDLRLEEVGEMVDGYHQYLDQKRLGELQEAAPPPTPFVEDEELEERVDE